RRRTDGSRLRAANKLITVAAGKYALAVTPIQTGTKAMTAVQTMIANFGDRRRASKPMTARIMAAASFNAWSTSVPLIALLSGFGLATTAARPGRPRRCGLDAVGGMRL